MCELKNTNKMISVLKVGSLSFDLTLEDVSVYLYKGVRLRFKKIKPSLFLCVPYTIFEVFFFN
jgi:hypothetical protein